MGEEWEKSKTTRGVDGEKEYAGSKSAKVADAMSHPYLGELVGKWVGERGGRVGELAISGGTGRDLPDLGVSRAVTITAISREFVTSECLRFDLRWCQHTMRKNAWTTLEEYQFLGGYIPRFLKQQESRILAPFLAEVAKAFLAKFPSRCPQFDRDSLIPVRRLFSLFLTFPHSLIEDPHLVW